MFGTTRNKLIMSDKNKSRGVKEKKKKSKILPPQLNNG